MTPYLIKSMNTCRWSAVTVFSLRLPIGCRLIRLTAAMYAMTVPSIKLIIRLQIFFIPHIQHFAYGDVLCLAYEPFGCVIFHCLAKQGLCFALAFRHSKLSLNLSAAFIYDLKEVISLFFSFTDPFAIDKNSSS